MRVLILEDDAQLADALATGLRQLGHVVDRFRSGAEADAALAGTPYDAMVLDLGLPDDDGMDWLRHWRQRDLALPVLILSARDGIEQRVAGLDASADDYLIRPIAIDEMAARDAAPRLGPHAGGVGAWRAALRPGGDAGAVAPSAMPQHTAPSRCVSMPTA